ncbi:hypothetical protein BDZ97DRAFT_2076146 [Flammula alnicola]|nr:hypothetical protein BDZ97DRAFT_2076146 [Flammula alnicola]
MDDEIVFLGTSMSQADVLPATRPAQRPVTGVSLHVEKQGGIDGYRMLFRRANTSVVHIGRRSGSETDRRLDDEASVARFRCAVVSRKHAKIAFSDSGHAYLIDLGSHHGTHIRKPGDRLCKMIKPETPTLLADGDVITFGKSVGKGDECVRPVVVRIELLHATGSTPTSPFKPLIVPSSSSPKSSSGRYGIHTSPSSSSDESCESPSGIYSDIEEIPPPSSSAPQPPAPSSQSPSAPPPPSSAQGSLINALRSLIPHAHSHSDLSHPHAQHQQHPLAEVVLRMPSIYPPAYLYPTSPPPPPPVSSQYQHIPLRPSHLSPSHSQGQSQSQSPPLPLSVRRLPSMPSMSHLSQMSAFFLGGAASATGSAVGSSLGDAEAEAAGGVSDEGAQRVQDMDMDSMVVPAIWVDDDEDKDEENKDGKDNDNDTTRHTAGSRATSRSTSRSRSGLRSPSRSPSHARSRLTTSRSRSNSPMDLASPSPPPAVPVPVLVVSRQLSIPPVPVASPVPVPPLPLPPSNTDSDTPSPEPELPPYPPTSCVSSRVLLPLPAAFAGAPADAESSGMPEYVDADDMDADFDFDIEEEDDDEVGIVNSNSNSNSNSDEQDTANANANANSIEKADTPEHTDATLARLAHAVNTLHAHRRKYKARFNANMGVVEARLFALAKCFLVRLPKQLLISICGVWRTEKRLVRRITLVGALRTTKASPRPKARVFVWRVWPRHAEDTRIYVRRTRYGWHPSSHRTDEILRMSASSENAESAH